MPLTFVALVHRASACCSPSSWSAPWLHTVEQNPLQDLIDTPRDAALFALVVVVAGGVREELQRAFLLRRFERWLGGARVGVVVAQRSRSAPDTACRAPMRRSPRPLLGAFWARRLPAAAIGRRAGGQPLRLQPAAARCSSSLG